VKFDGEAPVEMGICAGQGISGRGSPMRHVNGGAEKNNSAVEFGQLRGAPIGGGDRQVELQHREETGKVRRGPIGDEGGWGWELAEEGVSGDVSP
jgi:hypothetical protein